MGKLGYYIVDIQFNPIIFSMVLIIFLFKMCNGAKKCSGKKKFY